MRSHHTFRIGIVVVFGALAAGCGASPSPGSAPSTGITPSPSVAISAAPSVSPATSPSAGVPSSAGPTGLPTITKPGKPPKKPTDDLPETGWVAGMVTRGGSGPCYGLTADDGTEYALYSGDGIKLVTGDRAKVKLEPTLLKIYCGPGKLMAMTAAEPIG
jgi:hypothetical protein